MWIITGANGFIGSAIVSTLNQKGIEDLIVTDTVTTQERPELLRNKKYQKFLHTDQLFDFLKTAKGVEGFVHMGACSSTTEMNIEFLKKNNTEYTQKLFSYAFEKQIPFIYASSGAVYGDGKLGFSDSVPSNDFKPLNPYGWSKLNFDIWLEKQTETPPNWYGLRFFNVFGANENFKGPMSSVVFKAFQQIRDTGSLKLFKSHRPEYKNGEQLRDFVYVKDLTAWISSLMDSKTVSSGIYNMGYGKARTWLDLATAVFKEMGKPLQIEWIDVPENIRNQYQYLTEARMEKWNRQSRLEPAWPLEKGVHDYVQNFLTPGKFL
jgi:ADP-L-glycero-D-manno-heptose 6-epimerase